MTVRTARSASTPYPGGKAWDEGSGALGEHALPGGKAWDEGSGALGEHALPLFEWKHNALRHSFCSYRLANELNPDALRRPQAKNKVCSGKEFMDAVMGSEAKSFAKIVSQAKETLKMSRSTTDVYLNRLVDSGLVRISGGLYWAVRGGSPEIQQPL
jgi:hypothetical protein